MKTEAGFPLVKVPGGFAVASDPRDMNPVVDQLTSWETGSFEVPVDTPDSRVQARAAHYRNLFGDRILGRARLLCHEVAILGIEGPYLDDHPVAKLCMEPDRKLYILRALVRRRPVTYLFRVPAELDKAMVEQGFKPRD